jgi:hypothetical protein
MFVSVRFLRPTPSCCHGFVNLITAEAQGLAVPPSFLARADKVID